MLLEVSNTDVKGNIMKNKKVLNNHVNDVMKNLRIKNMKTQDQLNHEFSTRQLLKMVLGSRGGIWPEMAVSTKSGLEVLHPDNKDPNPNLQHSSHMSLLPQSSKLWRSRQPHQYRANNRTKPRKTDQVYNQDERIKHL